MTDIATELPLRLLRTSEAARLLGLSGRTLEKHRTYGTGPTYRKIGGRVVYAVDDLQGWANRGTRTSVKRRAKVTPYRRAKVTPLALGFAVARRRSAEPLAERSA